MSRRRLSSVRTTTTLVTVPNAATAAGQAFIPWTIFRFWALGFLPLPASVSPHCSPPATNPLFPNPRVDCLLRGYSVRIPRVLCKLTANAATPCPKSGRQGCTSQRDKNPQGQGEMRLLMLDVSVSRVSASHAICKAPARLKRGCTSGGRVGRGRGFGVCSARITRYVLGLVWQKETMRTVRHDHCRFQSYRENGFGITVLRFAIHSITISCGIFSTNVS